MKTVSIAKAKASLSELVDRAESGEEIAITRHGKTVARLSPPVPPRKPLPSLAEFRKSMPRLSKPSAVLIREMRDEDP
ncbi:MAG: type II toxin-antitoxin system prevent-host-death family antitoxin [Alphaproteobacteria bacterium]|nr:type II toxin-antitoxin system prevent-host-death family antitoxin [Alphaproteobacteria bacterium]